MMLVSVRWASPVVAKFGNGTVRQFDCVHDALDCLQHEWPSPRGKRHEKAVEVLGAALARLLPVEEARAAFVSACVECGILLPQSEKKGGKVRKFPKIVGRDTLAGAAVCKASG